MIARGFTLTREGRLDEALEVFLAAVAREPGAVDAHLAIYEVAQLLRRPELALEHQRRAIALAPIHTARARVAEELALLVPCVPGPFTANTPVEPLVDQDRVTIHRWYVDPAAPPPALPAHDLVWVAIGESAAARPALAALPRLLAGDTAPIINDPALIAGLDRVTVAHRFAAGRVRVARTARISRAAYAAEGFPTPHIVRPVDAHGGHDLERIDAPEDRHAYLARNDAPELYVAEYVDYRSADGFFRKYRIIFVDGEPFPYHLAISSHWIVHYYNAGMRENAWMREEEHRFLADLGAVFAGPLADALREVVALLPLDYFGIDCAIDRDGRLLLFEADTALLVHLIDDPALFGYKYAYVPKIRDAVGAMLRRRARRA